MPFVPTVPYADVTYADAYMGERLGVASWLAASGADKLAALKVATRMIDTLNLVGYKTDEDQVRQFPRNGSPDIPVEVADACCEQALAVIDGKSLDSLDSSAGISSESAGGASTSYTDRGLQQLTDDNLGLTSPMASRLMLPWLRQVELFQMARVG